jgi:hypothetical protein
MMCRLTYPVQNAPYMKTLTLCDLNRMKDALLASFDSDHEAYENVASPLQIILVDRPPTAQQLSYLQQLISAGKLIIQVYMSTF